nr:MAG TPA: hypothetical protein [Caudoviricetes sp.]
MGANGLWIASSIFRRHYRGFIRWKKCFKCV